jgi:hypothetical protein
MSERVDKAESVRNFYRRQGVAMERERIIKLLEDEQWHDMVFAKEVVVNGELYVGWRKKHSMTCNGCKQIALIKGETK